MVDLNLVPPNRSQKQLESLLGMGFSFTKVKSDFNKNVTLAVRVCDFEKIIFLLSAQGNSRATEILGKIDPSIDIHKKVKTAQGKIEKEIQVKLSKELNGQTEISTLAGRIDILTATEVIEVKSVRQWKDALGQVLVYGDYYPSHSMRIHLFGETQKSYLDMIKKHCEKRSVVVSWQRM